MSMNPRLLRPTASGFTPRSISGLALWLDFSDESTVLTATGVSSIADKSGNNRTFSQGVGNNQPSYANTQNGRKVATFDGANDSLDGPNIVSALPCTVLQVGFFPSFKGIGVTFQQLAAGNVTNLAVYRGIGPGDNRFRLFNGVDLTSISTIPENTWAVYGGIFESSSSTSAIVKNGTIETAGNAGTTTPSGISYLAFRFTGGGGEYTPMRLAETIIYSRALNAAEFLRLSRSLSQKWGFTL